jgi:spermidine synthase
LIRFERFTIRLAVFLGGAMLMAMEVAAFRMIGKTFGSALRETTAVIAVFLAAMSIGYWAGGVAGDRWPRPATMVAALLSAAANLLYVPWLDALVSPRIAASSLDMAAHAFLATGLLFAIPTFLFSTISPIAVRLLATTTAESGETAGSTSAISTTGSIAGSVLTAFFLIDWLASIARTVIFISAIACATAAILMIASAVSHRSTTPLFFRRIGIALAFAVVLVVPTAAFVRSTRLERSLLQSTNQRILFVGDSAYHRVLVRERRGRIRELLFNVTVQSRMDTTNPFGPGNTYTDSFHLAKLIRPEIKRVLFIGLGGGTGAKQFCHDYPEVQVDVVEVDPMVVDVAQRFFGVQPNDRLRIHTLDGRMFIKQSVERWDLIIIDAYTTNRYGDTIPPHLATREFFSDVASHLAAGGILHFHCAFSGSPLLPALEKTIAGVFPSVLVSKGEILASDVPLLTAKEVIAARSSNGLTSRLPVLAGYIATLGPIPPIDASVPLLTDDYAPVDTLIRARR